MSYFCIENGLWVFHFNPIDLVAVPLAIVGAVVLCWKTKSGCAGY